MSKKPTPAKKATKPVARKAAPVKAGKAKELTPQQRVFVAEYIKDRNGTQAAIRAGYSEKGAATQAERLLRNAEVRSAVDAAITKVAEKAELTAERTLRELARLAFFDPRKLLNPDGSPKPLNELDDDTAACLAGMDIMEEYEGSGEDRKFVGYTKKYKIADKNSALDKAMKHLGLFERDNEQKTNPLTELLKSLGGKSALPVVKDTHG